MMMLLHITFNISASGAYIYLKTEQNITPLRYAVLHTMAQSVIINL